MISLNVRSSGLSQFIKATSQSAGAQRVVTSFPSLKRPNAEDVEEKVPQNVPAFAHIPYHKISIGQGKKALNLNGQLFNNKNQALSGIGVSHQYRLAHTDFSVPDYSSYRKESTKDPKKHNSETIDDRRAFTYIATSLGVGVGGLVAAKHTVHNLVNMMAPAKDCLALSKIEVNIGKIPEGKNVAVKWRGKPVFIRHRTKKEIAAERAVDISQLRDPETDEKRAPNAQWLIVIGVCTHLGCVPIAHKGDFGGYYCPCHGSHYDASGRIRKGPAPLNLEIPAYEMDGDNVVIG